MIVMKFGGTSVGSSKRIREAADIIRSRLKHKPIVVVSAVGGITDKLIEAAQLAETGEKYLVKLSEIIETHNTILDKLFIDRDILSKTSERLSAVLDRVHKDKKASLKTMDEVLSFGERMSSLIMSAFLEKIGIGTKRYCAYDIGFVTDSNHGNAEVLDLTYDNVKESLKGIDHVAVVTGFIAKSQKGAITTLGRGGSDYTAALIGASVQAESIEIWTDVDGIRRTDPRVIKDAQTIPKLSFKEAAELAYFGAKVLHPKTILPAMARNIPVKVLNTGNPTHEGTTIVYECPAPRKKVRAIAFKTDVLLINVCSARMLNAYGFLERIFSIFNKHGIVVDVLATSEVSVSLTIDNIYTKSILSSVLHELTEIGTSSIKKDLAVISLVGQELGKNITTLGEVFTATGKAGIDAEMVSAGASDTNFTMVINSDDTEKCVKALHDHLFKR